jgi:hypothetical protein
MHHRKLLTKLQLVDGSSNVAFTFQILLLAILLRDLAVSSVLIPVLHCDFVESFVIQTVPALVVAPARDTRHSRIPVHICVTDHSGDALLVLQRAWERDIYRRRDRGWAPTPREKGRRLFVVVVV